MRQNFFKVLDEVTQDRNVVLIERRDAPDVAIISADELTSMMESLYLLRSPIMPKDCLTDWPGQKPKIRIHLAQKLPNKPSPS